MRRLLRAPFLVSGLLVLVCAGVFFQPSMSLAAGTAPVEAIILKDGIVPVTEVTRIGNDTKLCSPVVEGTGYICEENYPGKTRVTMTGSTAGWVITIRDKDNKIVTQETVQNNESNVYNSEEELVAERELDTTADSGKSCGLNALCWLGLVPGYLVSGLAYLLLVLSSLILWVAGTVFNWVIIRTVFQFATYFGTSEGMLVAWGVLRDIANIGLLFGFVFMGIATILNTPNMEGYSAKKALPRLIIFAVLLNFSLFATQGIIDVANGFASVFSSYAGEKCDSKTSDAGGESSEKCANVGISGKIIAASGITKLPTAGEAMGVLERPYTTATMLIMLSLLVTITAVVLFAAAIMLVIRVVVLSLLMVTSPIGFAGMAIPALNGIAKDWWHQLLNQSFFAPLYLLMVFISLKLVEGLQTGGASVSDAITGNVTGGGTIAGNMQVLVVYAVVIGFMVASLMVAKKMGAAGAGFATNAASAVVYGSLARATNLAAGGASRGALALARRYGGPGTVRAANIAHRYVGNANLDARRVAGMGSLLGAAGATSGAKPADHISYTDMTHQASDIREGKMLNELKAQADKDQTKHELNSAHGPDLSPELQKSLTSMSVKELEQLHGIKSGVEGLAKNLTPEQFSKLMEGEALTPSEKGALQAARFSELRKEASSATASPAAIKKILGNLGKSDLENLPAELLANPNVMNNLSGKQREDLAGSNKRTAAERQTMKDQSPSGRFESELAAARAPGGVGEAAFLASGALGKLSALDVAKIDTDVLTRPEVAKQLTTAMLIEFQDNKKLGGGAISAIAASIRSDPSSAAYKYVTSGAGDAYWS